MRKGLYLVFAICVGAFLLNRTAGDYGPSSSAAALNAARPKKIIEWGWDEPTAAWMKQNITQAETLPFDGFVLPLKLRDGTNMTWKMWSAQHIDYDGLTYMADEMAATPFKRLTHRFVRVNVTPGDVDWSDAEAWEGVLYNFSAAAKIAKAGGCKGFMFDTEQYKSAPLSNAFVNAKNDSERQAYRQLIRQRGRELMSIIAHEFPDITILFTFAYYSSEFDHEKYTYLPDLLDGMFEAAPSTVRLVDAWEHSYGYKRTKDYRWGYYQIKGHSAALSSIPSLIAKRIEAGFGVWLDATYSGKSWHPDKLSENYFTPSEFEASVKDALSLSEEYVWIYSEKMNWWKQKDIPPEYAEALRKAKNPG
jgi:hypothetical protein